MKILVIGAAGHVGAILRPALEAAHECRYLDLRPVEGAADRTVIGSLTDPAVLDAAMAGQEACVQLAMYRPQRDGDNVDGSYDVHVKGMHRVLEAAVKAGVRRVIYTSTLSVYERSRPTGEQRDESVPADAKNLYGLTKRLGEEVCAAFAGRYPDLSVVALRLVLPTTVAQWATLPPDADRNFRTAPGDLQRAYLAALALNGHTGYDAISICSDVEGRYLDLGKAARLLGWVPTGS